MKRKAVESQSPLRMEKQSKMESFFPSPTKNVQKENCSKPVLIVLPGASGDLSKGMKEIMFPILEVNFEVRTRIGKWKGWNPNSKETVDQVLALCPKKPSVYYILGHSFGNRVICSLFANDHFVANGISPPTKVILLGYPMYNEKGTDERVTLLQSVPSDLDIMCISGANDEFLKKDTLSGKELFESIINTLPCKETTSLHIIPGAGHGVIDVLKSKQTATVNTVVNLILIHCNIEH